MLTKVRKINGVTVTTTQPKSNFISLAILAVLSLGSLIAAFLLPTLKDLFIGLTIVFGLLLAIYGNSVLSNPL